MSIVKIRAALETALAAVNPAISIAYENTAFVPAIGVPYCKLFLLMAPPDNPTMGDGYHLERGIFQITLMYPLQSGSLDAATQAEVLKATFKRGSSLSNGGVTVKVLSSPATGSAQIDGERFALPIKVSWSAEIFG
jgi:Bacteriophage related domain of unknown function